MVVFTKEFGTLDPHLPIVWDKVPNKTVFFGSFPEAGYDFVQHHLSNFCPSFSFFFILPSNRTFNYYKLKSKHGEDLITLDLDGSQRENDHNLGDISDEVQILLQGFS